MNKIFNWFGNLPKDKILHFNVSALLALLIGNTLTHFYGDPLACIGIGASASAILGFFKEWWDEFTTDDSFSPADFGVDLLGAAIGGGIGVIPFV